MDRTKILRGASPRLFLDPSKPKDIIKYIKTRKWLHSGEVIKTVEIAAMASAGRILRVRTSERSFIVKQNWPTLTKDQAKLEGKFYEAVSARKSLAEKMPRLIGIDPELQVLVLEDLGAAQDYSGLYRGTSLQGQEIQQLTSYLSELHCSFVQAPWASEFSNPAARKTSFDEIFVWPFDPARITKLNSSIEGICESSRFLRSNREYLTQVAELGQVYLGEGNTLIHGEFSPVSWLKTARGLYVIAPKLCFYGRPEFDLGVALAHLVLARQSPGIILEFMRQYRSPFFFDLGLALRFSGVEIARRMLTESSCTFNYGLDARVKLLHLSENLVLHPDEKLLHLETVSRDGWIH